MAKKERRAAESGPLALRVRSGPGGFVRLEYSRAVAVVQMPADEARAMGEALLEHARRAELGVASAAP